MNIKKSIMLLSCLTFAAHLFAIDQGQLTPAQTRGLLFIIKLYGPHKKDLTQLKAKIDDLFNKILALSNQVAQQAGKSNPALKKSLEKKIAKIQRFKDKIALIKTAVQHCPLTLKTEKAQQAIATAGLKYLGDLNPEALEKSLNDIENDAKNLVNLLV